MRKPTTKTRIAVTAASLMLCMGLVGTAFADQAAGEASIDANGDGVITMDEWGTQYPLEWGSYHMSTVKPDGKAHGHYDLKQKLLAPVVRDGERLIYDEDGNLAISGLSYNEQTHQWVVDEDELSTAITKPYKIGCYSCKSSNFDTYYEENGAHVFVEELTQDFVDGIDGQVWDCVMCHTESTDADGNPVLSDTVDAQQTYFLQLVENNLDDFTAEERACGQCHNSLDYRSHITDQDAMDSFDPYRYGYSVEDLYQAALENGICSTDDAGIQISCFSHPELEMTHDSAMHDLSITCVDCHMHKSTDAESGQTFTNHNASGSPLDNAETVEWCMTCHTTDDTPDADAFIASIRTMQDKAAEREMAISDRMAEAHDLIQAAVDAGELDEETLDQYRNDYALVEAYWHYTYGDSGSSRYGVKVVHNAEKADYNLAQAETLLDEIFAGLGEN